MVPAKRQRQQDSRLLAASPSLLRVHDKLILLLSYNFGLPSCFTPSCMLFLFDLTTFFSRFLIFRIAITWDLSRFCKRICVGGLPGSSFPLLDSLSRSFVWKNFCLHLVYHKFFRNQLSFYHNFFAFKSETIFLDPPRPNPSAFQSCFVSHLLYLL